jgi:hypothetical protein
LDALPICILSHYASVTCKDPSQTTGSPMKIPWNTRTLWGFDRIMRVGGRDFPAKMTNCKNSTKNAETPLDTYSEKRRRGRPRNCRYPEIIGRAENHRTIFTEIWHRLSSPLLAARNEDEVTQAFKTQGEPYVQEFIPRLAADILKVIREKKFPRRPRAQIKFLANSLAGRPNVEPRTSRDICAQALA